MDLAAIVYQVVVLLLALSFHEMAHAWVAYRLGDPTAARLGRMTMNPLAHIDPVGTILFPALLIASGTGIVFGWAKPVPVNPLNLRRPRRDDALVAAAGPASNVLLALLAAAAYWLLSGFAAGADSLLGAAVVLLQLIVIINLLLAFFNLIPLPPLDGGGVLTNLLPASMEDVSLFLKRYGFFLLLLILFTGATRYFVAPAFLLAGLLLGAPTF